MPESIVESLEVIEVDHRDAEGGFPALCAIHVARQRLFQEASVEQSGQRITDGLFAQFLPQFQVGQRQLDCLGHRHGQLLLADLLLPSPRAGAGETQDP